MKIIIHSLLYTAMFIADFMGTGADVNPIQMESKILNGYYSKRAQHKYMASLQLNGSHICSSGMFQKGFLLTIGSCAWSIGHSVKKKLHKATAVLGDSSLQKGQRVNILKIAYMAISELHDAMPLKSDYESGVIMLADTVDYTHVEIIKLYELPLKLHLDKYDAIVCGWTFITDNRQKNNDTENLEHIDNLQCMSINLKSDPFCRPNIRMGNFKKKLICGVSDDIKQITTLGDVGSPLVKVIKWHGADINYIVGITLEQIKNARGTFQRFLRSNFIYDDVQQIIKKLKSEPEANAGCDSQQV